MASLSDAIAKGKMNTCCLKEENLYQAEQDYRHVIGDSRTVRRCRICNSRHFKMKAETINLAVLMSGPNLTYRKKDGKRAIRMMAKPR